MTSREGSELHRAARGGSLEEILDLIEQGAKLDVRGQYGQTPLHFAAKDGTVETVRALIDARAPIDARDDNDETPLHMAAYAGRTETAQVLIDAANSAQIVIDARDEDGETPLHRAAWFGRSEIARALVSAGANVNEKANNGATPLHLATRAGQTATMEALIDLDADIDAADGNGETPLHHAAAAGRMPTMKALIGLGANINAADEKGFTPLHAAARSGRPEIALTLIERGANVEATNKRGFTPLHAATQVNRPEVVHALIAKGADFNAMEKYGKTPLDEAVTYAEKHEALQMFLHNPQSSAHEELVAGLAQRFQVDGDKLLEDFDNLSRAQARIAQIVARENRFVLGEFVSGAADRINNPLNVVINLSEDSHELLDELQETMAESEDGRMSNEQIEEIAIEIYSNLHKVINHGKIASSTVRDMQNQIGDKQSGDSREMDDINRLLTESSQVVLQKARTSDSDFRMDLQFDCEEMDQVKVYAPHIASLVNKVVNNACYATSEKRRSSDADDGYSPALRISTRRKDRRVEIRFRDNGIGIPSQDWDKIFNPFFTRKPTGEGVGLGLTLCRYFALEHGGTIELVRSKPREFTEILVSLPISE